MLYIENMMKCYAGKIETTASGALSFTFLSNKKEKMVVFSTTFIARVSS